jgi:hypothetical protein
LLGAAAGGSALGPRRTDAHPCGRTTEATGR